MPPGSQLTKAIVSQSRSLGAKQSRLLGAKQGFFVARRQFTTFLLVLDKILDYTLGAENICIFALGAEAAFYWCLACTSQGMQV